MPIYTNKNGQQSGPYEDHVVIDQLRGGMLSPDDMGIRHGDAAWQRLGDMFPGVAPSPAPAPRRASAPADGVASATPAAQFARQPAKAAGGCRKPLGWTILAIGILVMLAGSAVAIATPYGYSTLSCDFAEMDHKKIDELVKKYEAAKDTDKEFAIKIELESAIAGAEASSKICAEQNSTKRMFQIGSIAVAFVGFLMLIVGFFIRRV